MSIKCRKSQVKAVLSQDYGAISAVEGFNHQLDDALYTQDSLAEMQRAMRAADPDAEIDDTVQRIMKECRERIRSIDRTRSAASNRASSAESVIEKVFGENVVCQEVLRPCEHYECNATMKGRITSVLSLRIRAAVV